MMARRETVLKAYFSALWALCAYRAITQSIVHDEALTYQLYLAGPAARIFDSFDANHHFLNTLLMKLSVSLFGVRNGRCGCPHSRPLLCTSQPCIVFVFGSSKAPLRPYAGPLS